MSGLSPELPRWVNSKRPRAQTDYNIGPRSHPMSNMTFEELTYSEKVLLSSVAAGAVFVTAVIIVCITKKSCWLHNCIWDDEKKKHPSMDDIICIRYPPDMYPTSVGIYRENIAKSPEDELARLFNSTVKRDSTYSSMSETSSAYELPGSPHVMSSTSSPVTATVVSTPESPDSATHLSPGGASISPQSQTPIDGSNLMSMIHNNNRQPFFTFALKYEKENGVMNIDFIEARNLPFREYLNQPSDVFFSVEIQPKKNPGPKKEMMRYRFVTKTIKKAVETCDFSETFLAQLSQVNLKDYMLRFTAFDQDRYGNPTELGSTSMTFEDFRDFTAHKLILSCSLRDPIIKRGEILIGLCYLPTAERMSVTIVKVTNLNPYFNQGTIGKQSICFVRVLLMRADTGRVLKRKKTTFQRLCGTSSDQPLFNETLVFDMPPQELIQTVLLVLVCQTDKASMSRYRHSGGEIDCLTSGESPTSSTTTDDGLFHYGENLNVSPQKGESRNSNLSANRLHDDRRGSDSQLHHKPSRTRDDVVGKVAFGFSIKNPIGKYHWEKMLRNPRNVNTEWHSLK
ncbi:unnamed protein product [Allacma fusca]|uniref:C2 domain-containing protein n=1 Tax=Allacma fusca TaxID=39272 RepID=A0A8J2KQD5_9HEXA|nr:unnamed protein product [Allacma fusca]